MFIKKLLIIFLAIIGTVNVPVYSMMIQPMDLGTSSVAPKASGEPSTWPSFIAKIAGAVTLCGIAYFKGYQRWSYNGILESVRKEFIEPKKDNTSPLFMHWRFSDFGQSNFSSSGNGRSYNDTWGSAGQLYRARKQIFNQAFLGSLHWKKITDKAGVPLKKDNKPDGFPLDSGCLDKERIALLPQVIVSMDYELSRLTAAMEKLAPMDPLLCPGLGIDPIEQVLAELGRVPANQAILDNAFNWKKPETWNTAQEKLINDTMIAKAQQQSFGIDWLAKKSWFSYFWYTDPYYKAREYYWTLYKFKSRLEQMKQCVQAIIDESNKPARPADEDDGDDRPSSGEEENSDDGASSTPAPTSQRRVSKNQRRQPRPQATATSSARTSADTNETATAGAPTTLGRRQHAGNNPNNHMDSKHSHQPLPKISKDGSNNEVTSTRTRRGGSGYGTLRRSSASSTKKKKPATGVSSAANEV